MSESQQRRPSRSHCQQLRSLRCPALAPVLEHYEAPEGQEEERDKETAGALAQPIAAAAHGSMNVGKSKCSTRLRILSKLRDGYVKLLNDVAWGADYSGTSSFYGCPAGGADHSAAFYARLQREAREKQARLQTMEQLQGQQQASRITFTGAFS